MLNINIALSFLENSLYRSPDIVRAIKSRRFRWAGQVARTEEDRSAFQILTGKQTYRKD